MYNKHNTSSNELLNSTIEVALYNGDYCISYGSQFYWWHKSESLEKTTDLPQFLEKLYHMPDVLSTPHYREESNSQS